MQLPSCAGCGRHYHDARLMVVLMDNHGICDECVMLCHGIVAGKSEMVAITSKEYAELAAAKDRLARLELAVNAVRRAVGEVKQ